MLHWECHWLIFSLVVLFVMLMVFGLVRKFFAVLGENERLAGENIALKQQLAERDSDSG
jgi:cell shape-determining protein MreC